MTRSTHRILSTSYSLTLALALFLGFLANSAKAIDLKPVIVTVVPQKIFTPTGFDNNDNAQVVIAGDLKDTCTKAGPLDFELDAKTKTIRVQANQYFYSGCWCAEVVTPYFQTIDLGILNAGDYTVVSVDENEKPRPMGMLRVSLSSNQGPDDVLYAPIRELSVDTVGDTATVALRGKFTNSCMKMGQVKVIQKAKDIVELLPVVEMAKENCKPDQIPFEQKVVVKDLPKGKVLFHVRSLDGKASNQVVEIL